MGGWNDVYLMNRLKKKILLADQIKVVSVSGMNRSRSCVVRPPIARVTRSAKSQAAHPKPTEIQDSEEGLYGKHKKIQMDSTPAADLCHMSVETQDIFITR